MSLAVMIVEDERIIAMDLQEQVRGLGYEVTANAATGADALNFAAQRRPDIVLMDVHIKGPIDGIATAERLREYFDVPVIFVTAFADDATLKRAKLAGPHGYLLKPINPAELKSTIELGVFKHQVEQQLRAAHAALKSEQLRSSVLLAQMNAAVENLTCGVAVTDDAGKIVVINQLMLVIFRVGSTPAETVGRSAFEVIFSAAALLEQPAEFRTRIIDIATLAKPVHRDRITFRDGRLYERDFIPAVLGDHSVGHVWCYYDVTNAERQRESLLESAHRDPLTGIPNRRALDVMLARRTAAAEPFALLFIDLDGFKAVNDTLGHEAGDAVLVEAASRLRKALRATDEVARFAGDEFVGIALGVTSAVSAAVVAKICAALTFESCSVDGRTMPVSASVGVALFPEDGREAATLLRKADETMYAMKVQSGMMRKAR
jgi:diguanylate cyclase (GGDEF)-like protein